MSDSGHRPRAAIAWILYDLANTIYSGIVITFFVVPYLTISLGAPTSAFGAVNFGSMVLGALLCPVLGALPDRTGGTRASLRWWTALCCAATVGLGLFGGHLGVALALLFVANLAYQVALIFYNALLPVVAPPERQGRLSGLGVGVGYLGVVFALVTVVPFLSPIATAITGGDADPAARTAMGRRVAFVAAGLLFFLFALPCLRWVPERVVARPERLSRRLVGEELRKVGATLRSLRRDRVLLFFFVGNFLCVDTVNTAIAYFATFMERVFDRGPETLAAQVLLGSLNVLAVGAGLFTGWLADRKGGVPVIVFSALMLGVALTTCAVTTDFTLFAIALLGPGTTGLAGIWTAGRKALLEFAPPERVGEYFGLYGVTTKLSVLGSLSYGIIADAVGASGAGHAAGHRTALGFQGLPLLLGIALLLLCHRAARQRRAAAIVPA